MTKLHVPEEYRGTLVDWQIEALCAGPTNHMLKPFKERYQMGALSGGLSHCGYDIAIGSWIAAPSFIGGEDYQSRPHVELTSYKFPNVDEIPLTLTGYLIQPGETVLAGSSEYFKMPNRIKAEVKDKSTIIRCFVAVQNTVIEPGWEGHLTLEISNHGCQAFRIYPGMPIAQVIFEALEHEPENVYEGKYQGQEGVTPPR